MTVGLNPSIEETVANGTQTIFPFSFAVQDSSWVALNFSDNLSSITVNVDQVSNPGGSVNYLLPPPLGQVVRCSRQIPITQELDIKKFAPFPVDSFEAALDKAIMLIQDANEVLATSIQYDRDTQAYSAGGRPIQNIGSATNVNDAASLADVQSAIGNAGNPIIFFGETDQEALLGFTSLDHQYPPGDVRRYGIVPDDAGAAAANTALLQQLCDNNVPSGYKGPIDFIDGATWYFNDRIPCRDGLHFNLHGSVLSVTKTGDATDTDGGFLHFLRDCSVCNGTINVNYTYVTGTNAFNAIMLGGRNTSSVDFGLLRDALQPAPFGNIQIKNLDIIYSGGTKSNAILGFGGIENLLVDNVTIDGNGTLSGGIVYEFGFATNEANAEDRQSSHASNWSLSNLRIDDIDQTAFNLGIGIRLGGAYNVHMENVMVDKCYGGIAVTPGEALFYNVWAPNNEAASRHVSMKNIVVNRAESYCVNVVGQSANSGYLSPVTIPDEQLVDLYDCTLEDFAFYCGLDGTTANGFIGDPGRLVMSNGRIDGAVNGIRLGDECTNISIQNVDVVDCTSTAGRLNFVSGVFGTPRKKRGRIADCFFGGNDGSAITIDNAEAFEIERCRFGYTVGRDGIAETAQDAAVFVGANATAVANNNYVAAVADAGAAYRGASGGDGLLRNPQGLRSTSSHWRIHNNTSNANWDLGVTLEAGTDEEVQTGTIALTANRTITLSTTNAVKGDEFYITHEGGGAFTLDIGGLVTVPVSTNAGAHVKYDGTAWKLLSYSEWA